LSILAVSWAYLHHFCAGIRHLVMDMHIGLAKHEAVKSARVVLVISGLLTLLVAIKLFGVI
ncbi:MAG: succinate dehydrogenase, cytochrome b556 subunit, partial [Betaproteobacteria bacterium]